MSMAGYNPEEAIPFWQRMSQVNQGAKLPEFLSTHPSDEARVKKLSAGKQKPLKQQQNSDRNKNAYSGHGCRLF